MEKEIEKIDRLIHEIEMDEYLNEETLPKIRKVRGLINKLSTPTPEERGEELVCDVCKGVGVRCIEDKTDDCWFCNGTGEAN